MKCLSSCLMFGLTLFGGCTVGSPPPITTDAGIGSTDAGADGGFRCPSGEPTRIRGVVRTPNGALSVSRAAVYVPVGDPDDVSTVGECNDCIDTTSLVAHTRTDAEGSFVLTGALRGTVTVVIEQGLFRRVVEVDVDACGETLLDPEATRLPRNPGEGRVPTMTVVEGLYDDLEGVVRRLGLDGAITVLPNDEEIVRGFLSDLERLRTQDVVMIQCANYIAETAPSDVREALRTYVDEGGRLFVTDQSYGAVEAAFPSALDFAGGAGDGLSSTPEPPFAANVGSLAHDEANPVDTNFRDWLDANGALVDGRLPVEGGAGGGFSVIMRAGPNADVLVEGDVTHYDAPMGSVVGTDTLPLMVSFPSGCGRVGYSSIHAVDEPVDPFGPLPPREMILAYLLFQVGTCLEDPVLI